MPPIVDPNVELQNLNGDVERLDPPFRKRTWFRKFLKDKAAAEAVNEDVGLSITTGRSGWTDITGTISHLLKWVSHQPHESTQNASLSMLQQYDDLIFAATQVKKVDHTPCLIKATKWYTSYLECKINDAWITLFRPVLLNVRPESTCPDTSDLSVVFEYLTSVVLMFRTQRELALSDIADKLYNDGLLRHTDEYRSTAIQLIFATIGWLSALYIPKVNPDEDCLQIVDQIDLESTANESQANRKGKHKSKTFTNYQQTLQDHDLAFGIVLQAFGNLIPMHHRTIDTSQHEATGSFGGGPVSSNSINVSLVCFHTLHKVSAIEIEWVDCLSLHLEFDSRAKTLKLFRFPSLCLLMYCNQKESPSLMSQIFKDANRGSNTLDHDKDIDQAAEYFKEILLSYRLIFGQTKASCKGFKKLSAKWSQNFAQKKTMDPLLPLICGHFWESEESRAVYDEVDAEAPANHYNSNSDFAYLGKRLVTLQAYVNDHHPKTFWGLWHDDRDVNIWWTFWAVILFGGLTIVFAILGLALQGWQVVLAQKQANQAQEQCFCSMPPV